VITEACQTVWRRKYRKNLKLNFTAAKTSLNNHFASFPCANNYRYYSSTCTS